MNKRIIVSIGIIVILVLFLFFNNRKKSDTPSLSSWEDKANEIILTNNNNVLRLYKKGDKWVINDEAFLADSSIVFHLEDKMKELKIIDFISSKPHYARFDLTPEKAIRITIKKDDEIKRDVLIGKNSSTSRQTYIKFYDKPEVYLASGNLTSEYDKKIVDIRDKDILSVGKEMIESIEIRYKGKKNSFSKKIIKIKDVSNLKAKVGKADKKEKEKKTEEIWICNENKKIKIDTEKFDSFIKSFDLISAMEFPTIEKKSLKNPICSFNIKTLDKTIELDIYKANKNNQYPCITNESPYIFTIGEWKAKQVLKNISDFIEKK